MRYPLVALLLWSCSSDGSSDDKTAAAPPPASLDAGAADAAVAPANPSPSPSPSSPPSPLPYSGTILFQLGSQQGSVTQHIVQATFNSVPVAPCGLADFTAPDGCCHGEGAGYSIADPGATATAGNAGKIDITVDGTAAASLDTPDSAYIYNFQDVTWEPGATVGLAAHGDEIKAFTTSLVAPPFAIGEPVAPPTISLSSNYTVTWTPSSDAGAKILVDVYSADDYVVCSAPDSAGMLAVPAARLAALQPGSGGVKVGRWTHASPHVANASVTAYASSVYSYPATLSP